MSTDFQTRDIDRQELTFLRPTKKSWVPVFLHPAVEIAVCLSFATIAALLEAMLYYNHKFTGPATRTSPFTAPILNLYCSIGFPVPLKSHNSAVQFLKSFVPTLVFLPLIYCLSKIYGELRIVQPYIDLSRGPAPAEHTVVLEYVTKGPFETARLSIRHGHWILTGASIVLLWSSLFPTLAGSLFAIKIRELTTTNFSAAISGTLGPNNITINNPVTYSGAAGYTSTSVYTSQTLPPFTITDTRGGWFDTAMSAGWMIPSFSARRDAWPWSDGDTWLDVETQALNIYVTCSPGQTSTAPKKGGGFSFTSSLGHGNRCNVDGSLNSNSGLWYGGVSMVDAECVRLINDTAPPTHKITNSTRPVVFDFARDVDATSAVYCYGYQRVFNLTVTADWWSYYGALSVANATYVPNHPAEGYVLNGIAVEDSSIAASQVVGNTLANAAILRAGIFDPYDPVINTTMQDEYLGTLNGAVVALVADVYLAYQLAVATSVWVGGAPLIVNGTLTVEKGRIVAIDLAVHCLAAVCALTALVFGALLMLHARERSTLNLLDRPRPSIAAIASLLSPAATAPGTSEATDVEQGGRSALATTSLNGIFEVVSARATHQELKKRLKGKRFRLTEEGVLEMEATEGKA